MEWRTSPRFPDYEISEYGDVRRVVPDKLGRILVSVMKVRVDRGYKKLRLFKDGKLSHVKICQLVADAFLGPKPFEKAEVCHGDGDRANDHYSNLRWDTHKGNHADTLVHGTRSRGERHGHAKLTEEQVFEIRRLVDRGASHQSLAMRFNVARQTLSDAATGRTWAHI